MAHKLSLQASAGFVRSVWAYALPDSKEERHMVGAYEVDYSEISEKELQQESSTEELMKRSKLISVNRGL